MLAAFGRFAACGERADLQQSLSKIGTIPVDSKPIWEPMEVYGWKVDATMYRRDEQFWWLVHAERKNETEPRNKDIAVLDKVLGRPRGRSQAAHGHRSYQCPIR